MHPQLEYDYLQMCDVFLLKENQASELTINSDRTIKHSIKAVSLKCIILIEQSDIGIMNVGRRKCLPIHICTCRLSADNINFGKKFL